MLDWVRMLGAGEGGRLHHLLISQYIMEWGLHQIGLHTQLKTLPSLFIMQILLRIVEKTTSKAQSLLQKHFIAIKCN